MTLAVCRDLRIHLQSFANGESMHPDLLYEVSMLKFVPCAERSAEGLHRDIKLTAKFIRLGPTRVSLAIRLPEIRAKHMACSDFETSLVREMEGARKGEHMAVKLGILGHPSLLKLLNEGGNSHEWLSTCALVSHRCDLESQFADHAASRHAHYGHKAADKRRAAKLHSVRSQAIARTYPDIMSRAISDCLRATDSSSSFFTLPSPRVLGQHSYSLQPLRSDTRPLKRSRPAGWLENDEVDDDDIDSLDQLLAFETICFRVLHGNPHLLKTVPGAVANVPAFSAASLVVTLQKIIIAEGGEHWIDLSSPVRPMLMSNLPNCTLQTLRTSLQQWQLGDVVHYSVPSRHLPPSTNRIDVITYPLPGQ